ncbi:MAG: carbohydrate ABC transporter substrate-binding protein [Clostridia bacterium]|nr:carbohydrate ABC transporter substrate-binding protein [Clostridia bacterium]
MRRWICLMTTLLVLMGASAALGEGVTLRTVSSFAGADAAAEAYVDILKAYEAETGNTVLDTSAVSDEAWKTGVLQDFAAGSEPDILFFFAAGADSAPILSRVVPVGEINEAYPGLDLPENDALRESDGKVYAVPVRSFWEGLFVNADVFEACGVELPADWESFCACIRAFREKGIVPIAISLSDIPHYLAEFALLSCASPEELRARPRTLEEVPGSWYEAMALLRELTEMGAFADNAFATDESASTALFRDKKAAMQIDGSWLVSSLPKESMESTLVLPVPLHSGGGAAENCIGGVSMGFYLTRRVWRSDRRDAAVLLLEMLTREDSLRRLGYSGLNGKLIASAEAMTAGRGLIGPLQDAMNRDAREVWLLECIPAVAAGRMTPEECWQRVMSLHPFGE